ncbi:hypothetical protein F5050DRAFT_1716272 [Lentinula boryana]|uniref:Uncharacterized protein n=1 Tax=Lentinula boryana TaxID=40481 RepID=A0ABQ8PXQ8_9AGAR|nr:hypothetical protein F5050DRAFT_1716272 [Lentinula boryana]
MSQNFSLQDLGNLIGQLARQQSELQTVVSSMVGNINTNKGISKPQPYDGKRSNDACRFIAAFELWANGVQTLRTNEGECIKSAISFLEGDVAIWATPVSENISQVASGAVDTLVYPTWQVFIELVTVLQVTAVMGPEADINARPRRGKDQRFQEALVAEKNDMIKSRKKRHRIHKKKDIKSSSSVDESYSDGSNSEGDSSSSDESDIQITNKELAELLPSKTDTQATGKRKVESRKKRKMMLATKDDTVHDQHQARPSGINIQSKNRSNRVAHPIWHFYDEISVDNSIVGSKYYRCYLGQQIVIEIKSSSRGNLTTVKNHIRVNFPDHWCLYSYLTQPGVTD